MNPHSFRRPPKLARRRQRKRHSAFEHRQGETAVISGLTAKEALFLKVAEESGWAPSSTGTLGFPRMNLRCRVRHLFLLPMCMFHPSVACQCACAPKVIYSPLHNKHFVYRTTNGRADAEMASSRREQTNSDSQMKVRLRHAISQPKLQMTSIPLSKRSSRSYDTSCPTAKDLRIHLSHLAKPLAGNARTTDL